MVTLITYFGVRGKRQNLVKEDYKKTWEDIALSSLEEDKKNEEITTSRTGRGKTWCILYNKALKIGEWKVYYKNYKHWQHTFRNTLDVQNGWFYFQITL